jgi:hypothetical protein
VRELVSTARRPSAMERRRACWNQASFTTSPQDARSAIVLGSTGTGGGGSMALVPLPATCCTSFTHATFKLATSLPGSKNRSRKHRSRSRCAVLRRLAPSSSCCRCATFTRLRFTANPLPPPSTRLYFLLNNTLDNESYTSILTPQANILNQSPNSVCYQH